MTALEDAFKAIDPEEIASPASDCRPVGWRPIVPVPADAAPPTASFFKSFAPPGYHLGRGWRYHDAGGRLLCFVVRYNIDDPGSGKKEFLPFTFCEDGHGGREWRSQALVVPRPLYRLDQLAARPDAPVLVVEGEKSADAAQKIFPDHVAITSPNGAGSAGRADWSPLWARRVVIWPDADAEGSRHADEVADLAKRAGAVSVHLVQVPESFLPKWDLADDPPLGIDDDHLRRLLRDAEELHEGGPIPLFRPLPAAEPYPIEALGPVLAPAAAAIARKTQVPLAIAAQAVLAVGSLAAQAHADVLLPYGQTRPLSLYLVTVAGSGGRKSTADNEALRPVRRRERMLRAERERKMPGWATKKAIWDAERKKIEAGNKNASLDERGIALLALGNEPEAPLHPFLTASEPTFEGLTKAWVSAQPALGIFSAEGGQFIGGHGMSNENRLRTAASYSAVWDGQPINRLRALDGVTSLHGRRLTVHLMVQPEAAARFLGDRVLRDQGLLSRFLVAAPESIAGTRLYRKTSPEDEAAIETYEARLLSVMDAELPLAEGRLNELEPRALPMSADATAAWTKFHDHVEMQCGIGEELVAIRDFALKAAEHAARIAGVLAMLESVHVPEIGVDAMECATKLLDWYLVEALRLARAARTDEKLLRAQDLLDWMAKSGVSEIDFRDIVRRGPAAVRTKDAAEDAIEILKAHGWVIEASDRPRRLRLIRA
jgi:hypothetical protein